MKEKFKSVAELVSEGEKHLKKGDFQKAEKFLAKALALDDSAPIRNNLATAIFLGNDPRRALELLEPVLEEAEKNDADALNTKVNPYTYALASRIYCALGNTEASRRRLKQAVQIFEKSLSHLRRLPRLKLHTFLEYTVTIMQAAADLGDHRQVFELYKRWESEHVHWQNRHLAAVACFNIGRYKRAASLWTSIAAEHRFFTFLQNVAFLLERGAVPSFMLEYELPAHEKMDALFEEAAKNQETRGSFLANGYIRAFFLAQILEGDDPPKNNQAAYILVYHGGEWGTALGQSILNSPVFSREAKIGAAQALLEKGVFKENEPIPVYMDGKVRELRLMSSNVIMDKDAKLDEVVDQARKLHRDGKLDEAIEILQKLNLEGKIYPPAIINLANYLRENDELDQAHALMEMMLKILPDEPVVLFNYSALLLQMGKVSEARKYYNKLKSLDKHITAGMDREFKQKMLLLEAQITQREETEILFEREYPDILVQLFKEEQRKKVEEKTLPANFPLSRGLKNMPADWLEAALLGHGITPGRRRREKEEQIQNFLTKRENLEKAVQEVGDEERELLKFLLSRGGFSRIGEVTRRFGSTEGDGFFWKEEEPASHLGLLWSRALVMVGKTVINNRRCKIASIPVELRPLLKEILS